MQKKKDENEGRDSYMEYIPQYSNSVLIGNWMQMRYQQADIPKNNCILPGLYSDEGCMRYKTLNQDVYTMLPFQGLASIRAHYTMRADFCKNQLKCTTSRILFCDNEKFCNNYTSTNTLMYEVWPKMRLEHCLRVTAAAPPGQEHFAAVHKKFHLDPLDCYGDQTKTPKTNYEVCERFLEECYRGTTTYRTSYRERGTSKRDQNKITGEWVDSTEASKDRDKFIIMNCNMHEDLKGLKIPRS